MTFAALSPWIAWLLILAALAATAATFLIPPRPSRLLVPSLVVWRELAADSRQRTLWERLRRIVSLMLALVIATAIALALARPMPRSGAVPSSRTLVVLDSSWSMKARTPAGATRWVEAVQHARAIVDMAAGEIALATTADGVIEGPTLDRAVLRHALDSLEPSGAPDGAWPRVAGASAVYFITDGAAARAIDPGVTVRSVFTPVSNVAVTAFDVRSSAAIDAGGEAFVAVANYASTPQTVRLVVTRGASVILERSATLGAGEIHREVVAVAADGEPRFHARVSAQQNALEIDDERVAWLPSAQPLQVAVVGGASLVPGLLGKDRGIRVLQIDPEAYEKTRADVWIFDRWLPAAAPDGPALVIDPPAPSWLGGAGAEESRPIWRPGATDRVLDGVDTSLVELDRARPVARRSLVPVAVSERNTPLVSVEDGPDGRYVVLGFSVNATFAATSAFPILIGNAIDWLARPDRDRWRQPGPVVLPARTRRVIAPSGMSLPLSKFGDRVSTVLPNPGLFLVESAGPDRVLAVGLGDPHRSNLLETNVPADASTGAPRSAPQPWWISAVLVALGLTALEWVTWRRRFTV